MQIYTTQGKIWDRLHWVLYRSVQNHFPNQSKLVFPSVCCLCVCVSMSLLVGVMFLLVIFEKEWKREQNVDQQYTVLTGERRENEKHKFFLNMSARDFFRTFVIQFHYNDLTYTQFYFAHGFYVIARNYWTIFRKSPSFFSGTHKILIVTYEAYMLMLMSFNNTVNILILILLEHMAYNIVNGCI